MLLNKLGQQYKRLKKQSYLNRPASFRHQYAVIGVGSHSIANLYPCLSYLGVPIKYIHTLTPGSAKQMAQRFPRATGTTDIQSILEDSEVKGVLICTNPNQHFSLAKQLLENGKNIFIEKPPCQTTAELDELIRLTEERSVSCLVGLQKRYAPSYQQLKKQLKSPHTYIYRYTTGAYPEGDPLLDLFIHPIDIACFLFGTPTLLASQRRGNKGSTTYYLHLEHPDGILGSLELSTHYSWQQAQEFLEVNTTSYLYTLQGINRLIATTKPKTVAGIPLEKILKYSQTLKVLYETSDFLPIESSNAVYSQGYYGAINTFLNLVEGQKTQNRSSPSQILPTYQLLQQLRSC